MAYSEKVLDHYENPRNVGALNKDDSDVGTGMVGAPACGDVMKLQIKVGKDGVIEDAKFKTYGCGSAIASSSAAFEEERSFVQAIEAQLPPRAMVFQLPHMTVPVDRATYPPMLYYDPGRAYLHSRALRWSWGAMIGRRHDWGRAVDALPLAEKAPFLALAGFSGIWIDRWGYTGRERPHYEAIERDLASITAETPQASSHGRYSFVSLESYRAG